MQVLGQKLLLEVFFFSVKAWLLVVPVSSAEPLVPIYQSKK